MIDVSDGLLADLGHICEASQVAAVVELDLLPLSLAARAIVEDNPNIHARLAAAGDDYELLVAAPADAAEAIAALSSCLGVPVTRIGRINVGSGVRLLDSDGHQIPLEATGYRHF
jgi:thiamine-monophosphate kinase